jgi:acetylornithine/N-succinyldiaminopimelate aminotransferase
MRHGVIMNDCAPHRIRLAPPLVLTADQAGEFLAVWQTILDEAYDDASDEAHGDGGAAR